MNKIFLLGSLGAAALFMLADILLAISHRDFGAATGRFGVILVLAIAFNNARQ
jgi:hypothetical protein